MTPSTPFASFPISPLSFVPVIVPLAIAQPAAPPALDEVEAVAAVVESAPAAPPISTAMKLARRAARGEVAARSELLRLLAPRITRVVRAVLGASHADREDVTQQALLAFVHAMPAFRGDCEPVHFASRIAARTAIASARRARLARGRRDDAVDVDLLSSSSAEPLDAALDSRRTTILRELLTRIPAEQAETITLRVVLGWSLPEVSKATGAPVNTVRSRLRLAKNALRAAIAADPGMAAELGCDRVPDMAG